MELLYSFGLLWLALVILILFFKKKEPKSEKAQVVKKPSRNDFEDSYTTFEYNDSLPEIFSTQYPFFKLIEEKSLTENLRPELRTLAQSLSSIRSDESQMAIETLASQSFFRKKTGLPKFLQIVPIALFLESSILIEATTDDLEEILQSHKVNELKIICKQLDIKPGPRKDETISRIIESGEKIDINYKDYFRINESVVELFEICDEYCKHIIIQQFVRSKLNVNKVTKNLRSTDIGVEQFLDIHSLKNYGYSSVVLSNQNEPLIRIIGYEISDFGNQALLLPKGHVLLFRILGLGRTILAEIKIINSSAEIVFNKIVEKEDHHGIKVLEKEDFLYLNLKSEQVFIMNTISFNQIIFDNSRGLNIYSIIDEASVRELKG